MKSGLVWHGMKVWHIYIYEASYVNEEVEVKR